MEDIFGCSNFKYVLGAFNSGYFLCVWGGGVFRNATVRLRF